MDPIQRRSRLIACILDPKGLGTGLICGADGWIVTNKHVAPNAGPFRVILADGRNVAGVGVHQSPHFDLAVVKISIDTPDYFDLTRDVSDDFGVGTEVWAIGHPRGCRFSVSRGIVSNPYRLIDDEYFVQSDAAINPGNSGGPLLDAQGQLVGIVSMMAANAQGLGFAVPGEVVADYVKQVRRLVSSQVVHVPEALLAEAQEKQHGTAGTARDGIEQLVATGRAEVENLEEEELGGSMKLRRGKTQVDVRWDDGVLVARSRVAALGPHEAADARLLYEVLELNASPDLGGAAFGIRDGAIEISMRRSTDRLSAVDAFSVVDRVLELAGTWSERIGRMVLERSQRAFVPTPENAPPPYVPPPSDGGVTTGQPMFPQARKPVFGGAIPEWPPPGDPSKK
ncbi:MAG: trypsin-like peptidase domain-containing protein [Sandaracinus sp.]|nr:trypsin-like peptidase domain-containing protein [Sandaracinus sp.]MCB9624002.1 trypsin-like peptidase domain-containing protein [Sandaracinus sp.]